jgi:UDP-glucose 4-epimerase
MNVLITGGAGFIGSHLAERCLAEGWNVEVLDDLSTGAMDNIKHLKSRSPFSYRVDSILNQPLVAEMVDSADVVFHLAAAVGVQLVMKKPVLTIETNVNGTKVVLRCAAKKGKRVMLASSSEVYGKSTCLPFREDANLVLGPTEICRWGYAASKALDEWLAMAYWHQRGLPITVVRLFNTVGPRQTGRYGMVLPRFVSQALRGEPLTVHETGDQQRCFSYVGDVVEALVRLAQTPEAIGEVVNIGNDKEVTMNGLAAMVREISGSSSRIQHLPYDQVYGPEFEDMPRRVPCLEKLERLIHYRPTTTLEAIIRRVVDYEWVHMEKRTMHATV